MCGEDLLGVSRNIRWRGVAFNIDYHHWLSLKFCLALICFKINLLKKNKISPVISCTENTWRLMSTPIFLNQLFHKSELVRNRVVFGQFCFDRIDDSYGKILRVQANQFENYLVNISQLSCFFNFWWLGYFRFHYVFISSIINIIFSKFVNYYHALTKWEESTHSTHNLERQSSCIAHWLYLGCLVMKILTAFYAQ